MRVTTLTLIFALLALTASCASPYYVEAHGVTSAPVAPDNFAPKDCVYRTEWVAWDCPGPAKGAIGTVQAPGDGGGGPAGDSDSGGGAGAASGGK